MTDLASTAARGAASSLIWQVVRVVVLLSSTVALARLLAPAEFGLVAMATAVIGIASVLRDFGLTSASVQTRELRHAQKINLFWVNTALGAALALVTWFVAPLVAALYGRVELTAIVHGLSVTFLLNGVATQFRSELTRGLRFGRLNAVDVISAVLATVSGIAMAAATGSCWSEVVMQVVLAAAGLVLAIVLSGWRPGPPRRGESVRQLLRYGMHLTTTNTLGYVTQNVDNVSIGLFLGAAPLGLYARAYQLVELPIQQVVGPMSRVAVPVLAKLQDSPERFARYLLRGQRVSGLVASIVYGLAFGLAGPAVHMLFGPRWIPMIPIFQALAVGGIFRALNQVAFWAHLSLGLTREQLRFNAIAKPVIAACMLLGLPWGPLGVAVSRSIAYVMYWWAALWWVAKVGRLDRSLLVRQSVQVLLLVAVPVLVLTEAAALLLGPTWSAIVAGVLLAILYLISLGVLSSKAAVMYDEVLGVAERVIGPRGSIVRARRRLAVRVAASSR